MTWKERLELAGMLLSIAFCLVVMVALFEGPSRLVLRGYPWLGVLAGVVAVPAWLLLGPRAGPGMAPGTLCVLGFFLAVAGAIRALVLAISA